MKLILMEDAWDDYQWCVTNDRATVKRINRLTDDIKRNGHEGIGKPEPLKHHMSGAWSRRITGEHRLVYILEDDAVNILQCRYHYGD